MGQPIETLSSVDDTEIGTINKILHIITLQDYKLG